MRCCLDGTRGMGGRVVFFQRWVLFSVRHLPFGQEVQRHLVRVCVFFFALYPLAMRYLYFLKDSM